MIRLGRLDRRSLGFSFERSVLALPLFDDSNTDLVALFRLLGPGMIRIGANSVDRVPWDPSARRATPGTVGPADVEALRRFLDAVDWDVLHGIPFVFDGASPATAADEAAHVAGAFGARIGAFEFGNEPDLYGAVPSRALLAGTPLLFRSRWAAFAEAVGQSAPRLPLSGPGCCLLQSIDGWTAPFARDDGASLRWVTQHYYRGFGGPDQTIPTLLAPDPLLASSLAQLAATSAEVGAAGFRITETNSFANGGVPGVSNTFASALWAIGLHLDATASGAVGLHFHNSGSGAGYPAIVQVDGVVTEIRPLFFGMLLLGSLGAGSHLHVDMAGVPARAGVHALLGDDGDVRVVVRNLDPGTPVRIDIDLGVALASASMARLEAGSLESTSGVTFRGASVGIDGNLSPTADVDVPVSGTTLTVSVAAASAAIVRAHPVSPIPEPSSLPSLPPSSAASDSSTPTPATPLGISPAYVG